MTHYARRPPLGTANQRIQLLPGTPSRRTSPLAAPAAVRPRAHIDIGSRVDGFVAHVLTFMPVTVVDIRPLQSDVRGLTFVQGDVCRLASFQTDSIESLSSLHAIEHIGLGRYGDPIAPDGWRDALRECARVLAPGGRFYFGTPVGRERLNFNS